MTSPQPPPRSLRVLVVDDEENIRVTLGLCLECEGHQVLACATEREALEAVCRRNFDLVFLDVRLGMANGLDLIPRILAETPWAKVVVITAYASADTAVLAMERGAADYLPKPFTPAQVQLVTRKVASQRQLELQLGSLQASAGDGAPDDDLPTTSSEMRQAIDLARRLAPSNVTLLIRGEVGTGKERLARAIHAWSGRNPAAYSCVSCRTESTEALEAKLFGLSSRDAPDAPPESRGKVPFCDGGTLVLNEIGDAPMTLQPRLLRLVHDGEYERQNDFAVRRADLRVIATTSADLDQGVARGTFRTDLLLAVNIVAIDLPPLRERSEDIRLLAERFRAGFARENHRPAAAFCAEAMEALLRHEWPGNVRELRNVVERAVLLCGSKEIGLEHLPPAMLSLASVAIGDLLPLDTVQEMHIRRVIASARSLEAAAAILGIDPATLWRRRKRYGL